MTDFTNKKNRGFSLIELLVAVSIMVILSTGVGIAVVHFINKAKVARATSDIAALKTAVRLYQGDNSTIPSSRQGLDALVKCPSTEPVPKNWREPYLDSLKIKEDPWGNEYIYFVPGRNKEEFEIVSYGADGQPGGDGFNADISSSDL